MLGIFAPSAWRTCWHVQRRSPSRGDPPVQVRTDGALTCWGRDEAGQVSGSTRAPTGRRFAQCRRVVHSLRARR